MTLELPNKDPRILEKVDAEEGCNVWEENEQELKQFPQYLEGSKLFKLPYHDLPKQTKISVLANVKSDVYIVYKTEENGKDWIKAKRKTMPYRKMRNTDLIKTSRNVLSNIWRVDVFPNERIGLPPTETENPLIIVFVNELSNETGTFFKTRKMSSTMFRFK